jgi:hypothetical protein
MGADKIPFEQADQVADAVACWPRSCLPAELIPAVVTLCVVAIVVACVVLLLKFGARADWGDEPPARPTRAAGTLALQHDSDRPCATLD